MPVFGRGKKNRLNGGQDGLKGWDLMQDTILSHDEDMIADYADDIDTLLVFAGLFSAVLTAFLAVSIVLLQPDNSQLSVQLLSLIALQNGAPERMQPFLNETAESLPTSTSFQASSSAVAINALWFISLVLSLAAALFGMLAKQWCREYLRWHSVVESARLNVVLRQMRFEAWEEWRVASYIAAIPALLEIALILFFAGLLAFIPTFAARSLTIVLSVVICGVLIGAFVLTLLPVFSRLCPFKSPTGWAFFRVRRAIDRAALTVMRRFALGLDRLVELVGRGSRWASIMRWRWYWQQGSDEPEESKDWRRHDLQHATDSRLCKYDVPGIDRAGGGAAIPVDAVCVDAFQTAVLVRSLIWVRRGLSDGTVLDAISECLHSIHDLSRNNMQSLLRPSYYLSAMHSICHRADLSSTQDMLRTFFHSGSEVSDSSAHWQPFELAAASGPLLVIQRSSRCEQHRELIAQHWASDSISLAICHALVRSEIVQLVDQWVEARRDIVVRLRLTPRIALLLSVLRCVPSHDVFLAIWESPETIIQPWTAMLQDVYKRLAPHADAYSQGLVSLCLQLSRTFGPVSLLTEEGEDRLIREGSLTLRLDAALTIAFRIVHKDKTSIFSPTGADQFRECNMASTWAVLAADIYHSRTSYQAAHRRHLFVNSVTTVFQIAQARVNEGHPVYEAYDTRIESSVHLLACMVQVLRWSLIHDKCDCGSYHPLSWIQSITACYVAARDRGLDPRSTIPFSGSAKSWPTLRLVLGLLKACLTRRLFTRKTDHDDFERLMTLLGNPELPNLRAELIEVREAQLPSRGRPDDGPLEPFGRNDIDYLEELICEPSVSAVLQNGQSGGDSDSEANIQVDSAKLSIATMDNVSVTRSVLEHDEELATPAIRTDRFAETSRVSTPLQSPSPRPASRSTQMVIPMELQPSDTPLGHEDNGVTTSSTLGVTSSPSILATSTSPTAMLVRLAEARPPADNESEQLMTPLTAENTALTTARESDLSLRVEHAQEVHITDIDTTPRDVEAGLQLPPR